MKKEQIKELLSKWNKESKREDKEIIFVMAEKFLNEIEEQEFIRENSYIFFTGLMYLTYKKMNIAFTGQDIAEEFETEQKSIFKMYRKIRDSVGIKLCKSPVQMGTKCMRILTPSDYIKNKEGKFDKEIIDKALELSKNYDKDLKYRSPISIASSCLYIGSIITNKKLVQRVVSEIMGITEPTLREVCKFVIEDLKLKERYKL